MRAGGFVARWSDSFCLPVFQRPGVYADLPCRLVAVHSRRAKVWRGLEHGPSGRVADIVVFQRIVRYTGAEPTRRGKIQWRKRILVARI